MIFLLITTDAGKAMATCLVLEPLLFTSRRVASTTSSNFSMLPSLTQPDSSSSMPQRSSVRLPERSCPSVLLLVGVALAVAYPNLPDIGSLTDYRPKLPLRVLFGRRRAAG
jgi:hypothetical protein